VALEAAEFDCNNAGRWRLTLRRHLLVPKLRATIGSGQMVAMAEENRQNGGPEIVFGLVGAVGTDLELVQLFLSEAIADVSYRYVPVQLSKLMHDLPVSPWKNLPESPEYERYNEHMTAGNEFRKSLQRGDALAMLAVGAIREARQEKGGNPDHPLPRRAYILKSLKHPSEVKALRSIYGPSFFLIAAYSPRELRKRHLSRKLASSEYSLQPDQFYDKAEILMKRDESERDTDEFGQNVRDTLRSFRSCEFMGQWIAFDFFKRNLCRFHRVVPLSSLLLLGLHLCPPRPLCRRDFPAD